MKSQNPPSNLSAHIPLGTMWMPMAAILIFASPGSAARITPETLAAWDEQVQQVRGRVERECARPESFIAADMMRDNGEAIPQLSVQGAQPAAKPVPSGLIHHWIGSEYIPDVRAADLLAVLQNYNEYAELYGPAVVESRLLNRSGNEFTYRLKFVQKVFGTETGLLGEFQTRYVQLDSGSGYSITEATQLTELQNPCRADERALTMEESRGFVEKMFTVVRYREVDHGLVVEIEALTLSRDIPAGLRWLVGPFVRRFSRQTMTTTLERIRDRMPAERGFATASAN